MENPRMSMKRLHWATQKLAITELETAGLRWVETRDFFRRNSVFERSAGFAGRDSALQKPPPV